LGAVGSIVGFIAIVVAILATARVPESSIAAKVALPYLLALTAGYLMVRRTRPKISKSKSTGVQE
jgi:zinc transporter ZupT